MNDDDASDSSLPAAQSEAAAHAGGGAGTPSLILVATPIGNLGDITVRAATALREADAILCEDTRVTARLLQHLNIDRPMQPLHDHNEAHRIPGLISAMRAGRRYALVSDAGTPLLSDPGFQLVRAVLDAGLQVTTTPGPNAALAALTLSALPPHPYLFVGFAPPRSAARLASFAQLHAAERAGLSATLIWHEAPHRLDGMLADLAQVFGAARPAAVARELTKRFEEVRRGDLQTLAAHYATQQARGEIMVLVGPPAADESASSEDALDAQLRTLLAEHSLKDAAALAATACGLPKRVVYARALELARETPKPG